MNVVAEMLLNEPAPLAIWAVLILLTLPAILLLGSPHGLHSPGRAVQDIVDLVRGRGVRRGKQIQDAVEAARYADEVQVAADRSVHSAQLWQEHWELAEEQRETAWQTWLEADGRLRAGRAAAAFGTPWTEPTPSEYAARERFLHRAVRTAVELGELPASAVADALAGRDGWDPRLHPLEQELVVRQAMVGHLLAEYKRAVRAELMVRHDARLAARTRDDLRKEAVAAASAAVIVQHLLPLARRTAPATARRTAMATTA
jgi:hypothetical protein